MNKKYSISFVNIMMFICMLTAISTVFNKPSIASLFFYVSFILLIFQIIKRPLVGNTGKVLLIIVILTFINVFINSIISGYGQFSFAYLKKYLIFISTLIFMQLIAQTSINNKQYKFILKIGAATGIFFIVAYYIFNIRTFTGIDKHYLTMNFSNPNLLAMWLLMFIMYIFFAFINTKKTIYRIVLFGEFLALGNLMIQTQSRTAQICLIFAIILVVANLLLKKVNFLNKFLLGLIILSPLIIALLYMFFFNKFSIIFDFMESEGKGIDSRLATWQSALYYFKLHPLIGSYAEASGGTGAFQMHNTLLDIMTAYGGIVTVLTIYYCYKIVLIFVNNIHATKQWNGIIFFLVCWCMGTTEAALFSGGQGIYILCCIFLLLSRYGCSAEYKYLMIEEE